MRTLAGRAAIPALAALALVAACGSESAGSPPGASTTPAAVTTVAPAGTTVPAGNEQPASGDAVEITVLVGRDDAPDRVETVALGQEVVLSMQSDQDEEYHLHGYELNEKAAAGVELVWTFTADKPGTFELESHTSDKVLLVLQVS